MPAPLLPPDGRKDLVPITLFPNEGRGMGYALTRQGVGYGADAAGELPEGYHRTINMVCRSGDLLTPFFQPAEEQAVPSEERQPFLVPWTDTDGGPVVLFPVRRGSDSLVLRYRNGELVAETDATQAAFGSATFQDDGTGTPYLYAGTTTGSRLLNRRSQGGVWAESLDVVAMHVVQAGGALWATSSQYEIRVCPAGSDPFVLTNWGAALRVGSSDAPIVRLGHLGAAPVAFKEDGIYLYDETTARFENRYPVPRSSENFPFVTEDGEGGLLTSVADGSVVWVRQTGSIATIHPLRQAFPWRDTPKGIIRDIAISGRYWYALLDQRLEPSQPSGLVVKRTVDFVTYLTPADVADGRWQTVFPLLQFANENLLVGFDDKFVAVFFLLYSVNTAASTLTAYVSTGGVDAGATWEPVSIWDGTAVRDAAGAPSSSLARERGAITFSPPPTWAPATLGGTTKYWLRLQAGSTPIIAWARDIGIAPMRAGPPFGTVTDPGLEATGLFPKLLRGELNRARDTIVWDDIATPLSTAPSARVATARTGSFGESITVLCQDKLAVYPLADPAAVHYGAAGADANQGALFFPSAVDLSGGLYALERVDCWGSNFDGASWTVAFRWDDTVPWSVTPTMQGSRVHFSFAANPHNAGTILSVAVSISSTGGQRVTPPVIHRVVAWVRPLAEPLRGEPPRAIPQEV